MGRAVITWIVGSVAAIVVGMLIVSAALTEISGVGTVLLVGGIVSFMAFVLFAWWRAGTQNDQWVWQTPHKPRREYLAEKAAEAASDSTGAPPDAEG